METKKIISICAIISIFVLIGCSAYMGAYYSCKIKSHAIFLNNFECIGVNVKDVCELDGRLIIQPEPFLNYSKVINVTY
jgi:hypothetical protein